MVDIGCAAVPIATDRINDFLVSNDLPIKSNPCVSPDFCLNWAALAFKLNKPLTARLFPVPGKSAGEMTTFENPYLCNTRIFAVP